ncbi:MAG TPA: hypothetical protein DHU56_07235 [Marinobacter sp.]|nr:hypothetical protein [Marinobacter sp.]
MPASVPDRRRRPDGDPAEDFDGMMNVRNEAVVPLSAMLLSEGQALHYEYDFGDGWEDQMVLEKITSYARDLIRKDQNRRHKIDQLQALVSAGIVSGEGARSMDELRASAKNLAKDGETDELHSQQEG